MGVLTRWLFPLCVIGLFGTSAVGGDTGDVSNNSAMRTSALDWQTYNNRQFGFQIKHPNEYEIVFADSESLAALRPRPLLQGTIREKGPRRLDPVDLASTVVSIRIFPRDSNALLEEWLRRHGMVQSDAGWQSEPYSAGVLKGVRVFSTNFVAPGQVVYFESQRHVFQLTPLGPIGEQIAATFSILE